MNRFFLTILMMILPVMTYQKASAADISGNLGISLYGGVITPTNGNAGAGIETTDFLEIGPQFGLGVSYFFTNGLGIEALCNLGINPFKEKYEGNYKNPIQSNLDISLNGVYSFSHLFDNPVIYPIVRAGVGIYNWKHYNDGLGSDVIKMDDVEHKGTSFGFNVGAGFDVVCPFDKDLTVGILVDYKMYFPKDEYKFGKDFAEQGYLTPQIKVSYAFQTK